MIPSVRLSPLHQEPRGLSRGAVLPRGSDIIPAGSASPRASKLQARQSPGTVQDTQTYRYCNVSFFPPQNKQWRITPAFKTSYLYFFKRCLFSGVFLPVQVCQCLLMQQSRWEEKFWLDCWLTDRQRSGTGSKSISRLPEQLISINKQNYNIFLWRAHWSLTDQASISHDFQRRGTFWVERTFKNSLMHWDLIQKSPRVCCAGLQSTAWSLLPCWRFHLGGLMLVPPRCPFPLLQKSWSHTSATRCSTHWYVWVCILFFVVLQSRLVKSFNK